MMVTVDAADSGLHRDVLLDVLRAENILAQPYFNEAMHQLRPYAGETTEVLAGAESLCERLLALPTGPQVDTGDVQVISDVVRAAVVHGPAVTARHAAGE
jgi:dTDP-4-amino-4,6-dideoxyglucose